jgi:hypothetical protein
MPVTIVNKIPDLAEREELNLAVEELLDSTDLIWNVRILPAADSDNLEIRAYALGQSFSITLTGTDGNLREAAQVFIRRAQASIRDAQHSGAETGLKDGLLKKFELLSGISAGIESWITSSTDEQVFVRLGRIDADPLSKVQLNQLLLLAHEAGVSDGFFRYYWLSTPLHPYDVTTILGYDPSFTQTDSVESLQHLIWGLYRLYVDALLFFGNIRSGYRFLRSKSEVQLNNFFGSKRFNTNAIRKRGPALPLVQIPKDNRYLISEMACKSYDSTATSQAELETALRNALDQHLAGAGGKVSIRSLLDGSYVKQKHAETQQQLIFSADDLLSEEVGSVEELQDKLSAVFKKFSSARDAALQNTRFYLSMVHDLDVYVATSMRTRQDFRAMADACETIFSDARLKDLELRYFDPTLSAAAGHEDKGLIECLMVKCAKVLVYCAGEKESYGKDAEAAMALSLGKPVIFLCDVKGKGKFYRDVHPLSRLIDFSSGVAVGAMIASSQSDVSELLFRIFENKMQYELEQPKPGYFRLREKLTDSVVRVQTNFPLLRETFWNYYNDRPGDET